MGKRINMISEPEAIIYALQSMDPSTLSVGDNFVCMDAGGDKSVSLVIGLGVGVTEALTAFGIQSREEASLRFQPVHSALHESLHD